MLGLKMRKTEIIISNFRVWQRKTYFFEYCQYNVMKNNCTFGRAARFIEFSKLI